MAELTQSAKDYFGVTRSPNETGYIMQDGTRLDLSGRHYAGGYEKKGDRFVPEAGKPDYLSGDRAVDHRELYDLKGLKEGEHQWDAVEQLMRETGAVRYMPNQGISIIDGQKVSNKQLEAIVTDFRKSGNPLTVDIDPVGGGSRAVSKTFDRPTVEGVREFIELGASPIDLPSFKPDDEPRPVDPPSVFEKGIMAADLGSKVADEIRSLKKPTGQELVKQEKTPSKGQMFRGIGSLMRKRISPLVTAAQLFWDEIPDSVKDKAKDNAGEIVDWLRENKMHKLVGLDKSGLGYFKEALGIDVPKLAVDNPGGDWLARKIEYAKEKGKNEYGAPHLGAVTASFRKKVNLPVDLLATFKGLKGEQGQVREKALAWLKKHMEETGKLPLTKSGGEYAPFITVGYDGVPWVSEGNHRIMAAKALGWKTLPVELRYFDGGERTEGLLSPEKVRTLHTDPKYQLDQSGLGYFKEALGLTDPESKGIMSQNDFIKGRGDAFDKLAAAQRGDPEGSMVEAQRIIGGSVLSSAIEHVGDLTHRMADKYNLFSDGLGYDVDNKVKKALHLLRHPYGFGKEVEENFGVNAPYFNRSVEEHRAKVTEALKNYGDAHRQLEVYNEPQKWARDAAISLGDQNWEKAESELSKLEELMKDKDAYRKAVGSYKGRFFEEPTGLSKELLIMPCGSMKDPAACAMEAAKRYVGPLWQSFNKELGGKEAAKSALDAMGIDIHILSAKHGLIPADTLIENYDHEMTPERIREIIGDKTLSETIRDTIKKYDPDKVHLATGKKYSQLITEVMGREYPTIFPAGTGQGSQRAVLTDFLKRKKKDVGKKKQEPTGKYYRGGFVDKPLYEQPRMVG